MAQDRSREARGAIDSTPPVPGQETGVAAKSRTLYQPNFYITYWTPTGQGRIPAGMKAVYLERNSTLPQTTVVEKIDNAGNPLDVIFALSDRDIGNWKESEDAFFQSHFQVYGYCQAANGAHPYDHGVIFEVIGYSNGVWIAFQFDDAGGAVKGPDDDFNDNISGLWLPLNYGTDYTDISINRDQISILLVGLGDRLNKHGPRGGSP